MTLNFPFFSSRTFKRGFQLGAIFFMGLFLYWIAHWMTSPQPGAYKIGMDSTWYPLPLYGKEHCTTAFSTDLLFAVGRNQSINVEIVKTGHQRLMELLDDKMVDGVLTSLEGKGEEKYYFSDPYYRFGAVLVVRRDSVIHSMGELSKKRVGIKRSSPVLYRLQIDPEASIIPYESPLMMFQDLSEKKVDALLLDQLILYAYFAPLYRDQLKVITTPMTNEGLRLVTLKDEYTLNLIEKFNSGLKNLQSNGIYDQLIEKWELHHPEKICD